MGRVMACSVCSRSKTGTFCLCFHSFFMPSVFPHTFSGLRLVMTEKLTVDGGLKEKWGL